MARRDWSASNLLRCGSAPVTAIPLTLAAWAKTSITNQDQTILGIYKSSDTGAFNNFHIRVAFGTGAPTVKANVNDNAGGGASIDTTTNISANTWFHACGVFTSNTSRSAFLNGGGKATDTTSITPSGVNRTSIGLRDNVAADRPFAPSGTGDIAEAAIWNIALSDADVAALAKGVAPFLIHPEALVAYWPILGANSPENNLRSNSATMAIQGSLSKSAHPRIFMPPRQRIRF